MSNSKGDNAIQSAMKATQRRGHAAKTQTHRYERRKVREVLRGDSDLAETGFGQEP